MVAKLRGENHVPLHARSGHCETRSESAQSHRIARDANPEMTTPSAAQGGVSCETTERQSGIADEAGEEDTKVILKMSGFTPY